MNWQIIIAFGVAVFSIASYVLTRRRELAWRRTEFLCAQSQYLDTDPELSEVVRILEDRDDCITIDQIFGSGDLADSKRNEYLARMDKLLNFLWRLCYATLKLKTLSKKEIEGFSWYLWRISQNPSMVEYCENNGFEDINTVIALLAPSWREK